MMEDEEIQPAHTDTNSTLAEKMSIKLLERKREELESNLEALNGGVVKGGNGLNVNESGPSGEEKEADSEKKPDEKNCRIRIVLSKMDNATGIRKDFPQEDIKPTEVKPQGVATFRRCMDTNGKKLVDEEIDVESDALKELLAETLDHFAPGQFRAEHVNFVSPFREFVWQWAKLEKACEPYEIDTKEKGMARQDLKRILALIQTSDSMGNYFNNLSSHEGGDTVAFKHIWTLFEPGTKIYMRAYMDEMQMFEVKSTRTADRPDNQDFIVAAASFDWNGVDFKPCVYNFVIQRFEGSQSITNLPCFPVKYYHNTDGFKLEDKLLKRGKRFYELCLQREVQYEYQGSILFNNTRLRSQQSAPIELTPWRLRSPSMLSNLSDSTYGVTTAELSKSKVIIDNYSYMRSRRNPGFAHLALGKYVGREVAIMECLCYACKNNSITNNWSKEMLQYKGEERRREEFAKSTNRLLLCPPKVLGYSLKLRCWCQFSVNNVKNIDPSTAKSSETFDSKLELGEDHKTLLKAVIENHETAGFSDLVEGKGKGLVILLHGPPGVGKTLTAETLALATAKPLLSVSTAEIGIEPHQAETNFTDIFEDASRWKAILLIDEADVFLEERKGTRDLQRNTLVAVLLRVLEYYDGIIILTTNRITALDIAVQSRIHVAIQYRDLNSGQQQKIAQNFLNDVITNKNIENRSHIDKGISTMFKRSRLNGRQIRNILQSAFLVAQSHNSKLKLKHIEHVKNLTEDFQDSLKDLTRIKREQNEAPCDA